VQSNDKLKGIYSFLSRGRGVRSHLKSVKLTPVANLVNPTMNS
jgi:hypothetical protein